MGEAIRADEVVSLQRASICERRRHFAGAGGTPLDGPSRKKKRCSNSSSSSSSLDPRAGRADGSPSEGHAVRLERCVSARFSRPRRRVLGAPRSRAPARPRSSPRRRRRHPLPSPAAPRAHAPPRALPPPPRRFGGAKPLGVAPEHHHGRLLSVVNLIAALCVAPSPLSPPPRASDLARPALGRASWWRRARAPERRIGSPHRRRSGQAMIDPEYALGEGQKSARRSGDDGGRAEAAAAAAAAAGRGGLCREGLRRAQGGNAWRRESRSAASTTARPSRADEAGKRAAGGAGRVSGTHPPHAAAPRSASSATK